MARGRHPNSFPSEYPSMIEACCVERDSFTLPVKDKIDGVKERAKFYSYIGALRRERDRDTTKNPMEQSERDHLQQLCAWAERVAVWVGLEDNQQVVKWMNRDDTQEAINARIAMANRKHRVTTADNMTELDRQMEESAQRLEALQATHVAPTPAKSDFEAKLEAYGSKRAPLTPWIGGDAPLRGSDDK